MMTQQKQEELTNAAHERFQARLQAYMQTYAMRPGTTPPLSPDGEAELRKVMEEVANDQQSPELH